MSCQCCQQLAVSIQAVWNDNGSPFDLTETAYDHPLLEWYLAEAANLTGTGYGFTINGGLIARGASGLPGDSGYGMALTFTSKKFPVPAKLTFDAVLRGDLGELDRTPFEVDLPTIDTPVVLPFSATAANTGLFMENRQILIGRLSGL